MRALGGQFYKTLPVTSKRLLDQYTLRCFDGDLRGKVKETVAPFAAFLPGDEAIETIFRELITADVAGAAEALSKQKLGEILFTVEGADHHDWYQSLCEGMSLTKAQLFPMFFGLWIRQAGNEEAAFGAMASFRAALAVRGTKKKQD